MKSGDKTDCPHCGQSTIVREKVETDGWQVVGKVLVCAFCGKSLGTPEEKCASETSGNDDSASLSGLASLLGAEPPTAAPRLDTAPDEARFCRDCVNYVAHPFLSRCELRHANVNPMDDCPDFERKPEPEN